MRFRLPTLIGLVSMSALLVGWWRIDPVTAVYAYLLTAIVASIAVSTKMTAHRNIHVAVGGIAGAAAVIAIGWLINTETMRAAIPAGYYAGHYDRKAFLRSFGYGVVWYLVAIWTGCFLGAIFGAALQRLRRNSPVEPQKAE